MKHRDEPVPEPVPAPEPKPEPKPKPISYRSNDVVIEMQGRDFPALRRAERDLKQTLFKMDSEQQYGSITFRVPKPTF